MKRGNGILLAISSLPGKYGIGSMGAAAREFIDLLAAGGQKYWQVLPVSPTGYGDSPYQSMSVFAGNPYFIDFEELCSEGLLSKEELFECEAIFAGNEGKTDYYLQFRYKGEFLRRAYARAADGLKEELEAFAGREAFWLRDYALYMAIKASQDMKPWLEWPEALAFRDAKALYDAQNSLKDEIAYHIFVQYLFFRQWQSLRRYANEKGIAIIGDMPIYMAKDSADAWANAGILGKSGEMAGCPPDYFCATGQRWGNPVYDWEALKASGYGWWVQRVQHNTELFDYVRIDHFRGFESYYAIPAGCETAVEGRWVKGPGMALFDRLKEALGDLPLIAEDLGFLTEPVVSLLKETGFPGLKVLQFAFHPGGESIYLPHRYDKNCVVYTGTHDNDTVRGWYAGLSQEERDFMEDYVGYVDGDNVHWRLIRLAMASVADVCILPMQDVLGLSSDARMNTPQTVTGNWAWRLREGEFNEALIKKLRRLTAVYGR